ncbi:COBRA-like protein 5 [Rhodamnia argentea]|uniref:COBRA-like protein 5 n=1 Tax=Rhodamnia argentea TaxID=178133 RepID=A0A8B8NZ65_9MYRT|nr:COBRA-like protein 5 [Rhodamnia argentea]
MEATLWTPLLCLLSLMAIFTSTRGGGDPLDLNGNITLRWDVMSWTPDGYVALVNIANYQQYRTVMEPGWRLQWTWARKEVIWSTVGARPLHRGDCSSFKGNMPASCMRSPTIVDLTADVPLTDQIAGCCKGGVLLTQLQDARKSTAEFQIAVGNAGTTKKTVQMPKNYTLTVPGGRYSCSTAKIVRPTQFLSPDRRRITQALMTWQVVCRHTPPRGYKPPCCVSLSSDRGLKIPCGTCACNCKPSDARSCAPKSPVQCTNHMCPVSINWHLLSRSKGSVRWFEVSISNLNRRANYTDWILMIQHPVAQKFASADTNYWSLPPKLGSMEVVWGIKHYSRGLGPLGSGRSTAKFEISYEGSPGKWNFSSNVFFNGDRCANPPLPR